MSTLLVTGDVVIRQSQPSQDLHSGGETENKQANKYNFSWSFRVLAVVLDSVLFSFQQPLGLEELVLSCCG